MNADPARVSTAADIMNDLYMRCRTKAMSVLELFKVTDDLQKAGLKVQAAEVYKNWVAYNHDDKHAHMAYFNYAIALRQLDDLAGSIQALQTSLRLQDDFAQSHINLGRAYEDAGLIDRAVAQWLSYAAMNHQITPDRLTHKLMAMQHAGRVLENHNRLQEAEDILWQAIELRPDKKESAQHWIAIRQKQCKWPLLKFSEYVSMREIIDGLSPMTLACYMDDPIFQMAKAYRYCKTLIKDDAQKSKFKAVVRQKLNSGQKIRVGYLSSDLREHAVGFALSEVVELHDKSRFEIYAYYCGERKVNDSTQIRIQNAMDKWTDINGMSDAQAAEAIIKDEIDILLDVNGFTKNARTNVFSYRPAPVIASFCGYPGTLGSPYHHYVIADDYIVPTQYETFYTETVLRITCNQPIDRKRAIGPKPSRATYQLPEHAVVFACFNGMQKLTEACFQRWLDILKAVPNSVLWLLEGGNNVDQRLTTLAKAQGVEPHRLIFAGKVPNADHLARIALADIFLDTFPYGAHSTGSDAITMGLPVLTFPGNGFASRFCASIVNAAGISSLIATSPEDYTQKAIELGNNPEALKLLKAELQSKRKTSLLRDTDALVRSLEECLLTMQQASEAGNLPRPDFRNMDVYYDIGAEMIAEGFEYLSVEEYKERYLTKLRERHTIEPIPSDSRLWRDDQIQATC